MRPLVNCQLRVGSNANASAIKTFVEGRIAQLGTGFSLAEPVTVIDRRSGRGYQIVNFSVLCATAADADQLFIDIQAAWTSGPQANRILAGSTIKRTNNYDDEGLGQPDDVLNTATKA